MGVTRKPHPFGNECHKICFGITSIFWRAHIFEGSDRPAHIDKNIHSDLGITVGLVLQMYDPLFYMVKAVVTDSGFLIIWAHGFWRSKVGISNVKSKGVYVPVCTVFARHYLYRGDVDNQNAIRHVVRTKHKIGWEDVCINYMWEIISSAFFRVCIEVNSHLCLKCFLKKDK